MTIDSFDKKHPYARRFISGHQETAGKRSVDHERRELRSGSIPVEVEAKAKEIAVLKLRKELQERTDRASR